MAKLTANQRRDLLTKAKAGDVDAQCRLAAICGRSDKPSDLTKACFWARKAAEQGNAWAQTRLGAAYRDGRGVRRNHKAAAIWFKKAALQGDPYGQCNLANAYDLGQGVPKNPRLAAKWYRTAVKWFRKAAEQGDDDAQDSLAYAYSRGEGIAQRGVST